MMRAALAIAAIAGIALIGPAARSPAHAVPNVGIAGPQDTDVIQVRRSGHRMGHMRMGRHSHFARIGRHGHFAFRNRYRHYGHSRHFGRYYGYGGGAWIGGSCQWLRYKALATGSSYWWHRYYRCRHGW